MDEADAKQKFSATYGIDNPQLKQDEDCLDTWFSSWLWPFEVFKGISNPGNKDVAYYYPTNTLVTAPEIIFFWVARMVMAGYEYMGKKPFKDVYFTGIVRDLQGRKMSKQLGNSPDLLEMIDDIVKQLEDHYKKPIREVVDIIKMRKVIKQYFIQNL